ncbi:MAG: hypothetical protein HZA51_16890 [Planctomycetes bacterium]|nr:hypothetical protein [Planctomycetota bacterium]
MPRRYTRAVAALLVFTFGAPTNAGPRTGRHQPSVGEHGEPAAPEGLEFHNPLVDECMGLLRKGDAVQATTKLEQEVARAVGDEKAELQLGLAMLYLRSGQQAKARPVLTSLVNRRTGGSVSDRAAILERVMKQPSAKKSGDLMDPAIWANQLTKVANNLANEVTTEHQSVFAAMRKEDWAQVTSHVSNARERVRIAREIKADNAADAVVLKHVDGLACVIRQINSDFDQAQVQAKQLRQQVREYEKLRQTRLPGGAAPNANAKIEYNALVARLHSAWDAVKPIDDELGNLTEEYGSPRIKKRDRLIPKSRLPIPL